MPTSNLPEEKSFFQRLFGSKKSEQLNFRLSLGDLASGEFVLTANWQKFSIGTAESGNRAQSKRISPQLELISKGTAWFDVLEVVPDMEIVTTPFGEKGAFNIQINSIHDGSDIHYTLDGSEPTEASELFIGPLFFDKSVALKAAAFKEGKRVGFIEKTIALQQ